ncbi:MAG TPA: HNH endonuclease, partial [Longimicrobiales bacterium]|nr:HNH endonuclease [Longimicrobiales bacterium]
STREIADELIRLYWRQVAPFVTGEEEGILSQNTGRQAAIVRELAERHDAYEGSLAAVRGDGEEWRRLRSAVQRTVQVMPLWKLQTVGSERLDFLYENRDAGDAIRLEPGVAYCFRAFHPMITDMIRGAWAHFVQRRNPRLLGQVVELRSFLFGSERAALAAPRPVLRDVQDGRCFYCERPIRSGGQVDHFIPWSRYPLDLGHNFVLAHQGCNSRKSDLLAAEEHLDHWMDRNRTAGRELGTAFEEVRVQHDLPATVRIARWAYGQVHRAGGQVWVRGTELRRLGEGWEGLLG